MDIRVKTFVAEARGCFEPALEGLGFSAPEVLAERTTLGTKCAKPLAGMLNPCRRYIIEAASLEVGPSCGSRQRPCLGSHARRQANITLWKCPS